MTGAPRPITGRCLCGGVTYSADTEPVVQAVCHCADCQRQTGNPFSVIVGVPRAAFNVEGARPPSSATMVDNPAEGSGIFFLLAAPRPSPSPRWGRSRIGLKKGGGRTTHPRAAAGGGLYNPAAPPSPPLPEPPPQRARHTPKTPRLPGGHPAGRRLAGSCGRPPGPGRPRPAPPPRPPPPRYGADSGCGGAS